MVISAMKKKQGKMAGSVIKIHHNPNHIYLKFAPSSVYSLN